MKLKTIIPHSRLRQWSLALQKARVQRAPLSLVWSQVLPMDSRSTSLVTSRCISPWHSHECHSANPLLCRQSLRKGVSARAGWDRDWTMGPGNKNSSENCFQSWKTYWSAVFTCCCCCSFWGGFLFQQTWGCTTNDKDSFSILFFGTWKRNNIAERQT